VPKPAGAVGETRRETAPFLSSSLHDGSVWLPLACVMVFAGVVIGLYTRGGSEISSHPYVKGGNGGGVRTDLPSEATGREELEPRLWPRRAGLRAGRQRR
jgi:hypothetical protein